jgi:uncharacterized damage-inducible protein DinB
MQTELVTMDERETLLADLDQELAVTRRLIARIPEASLAWRPHEKSFTLGGLATHLARLPHWGAQMVEDDAYDLASATSPQSPLPAALSEILALFDTHVAELRGHLVNRPAAALGQPWTLRKGTQTLLRVPRGSAVRRFCLQHLIHHRGQLTVYLRLLNVSLPPIYGPTADEAL